MLEEFQLEQIVKPLLAWFVKKCTDTALEEYKYTLSCLGVGDHAAADPCGGSETIF